MIKIFYEPNTGHETRSKLLARALDEMGMAVIYQSTDIPDKFKTYIHDILIYDVPNWKLPDQTGERSVIMGTVVSDASLCWHPLGPPGPNVLTGKEYIMVGGTPTLERSHETVVYLGESHPLRDAIYDIMPYKILEGLTHNELLQALRCADNALLGWGQSCFEASHFGVPYLPIAATDEHVNESWRFGQPAMPLLVAKRLLLELEELFPTLIRYGPMLDNNGARRTAEAIVKFFGV